MGVSGSMDGEKAGVAVCSNQSTDLLYGLMDLFLQDGRTGLKSTN